MAFGHKPWLIIRVERLLLLSVITKLNMATSTSTSTSTHFNAFFLVSAILAVHVALSSSSSVDFSGNLDHQLSAFFLPAVNSGCSGSIAECSALTGDEDDTEFLMESESNRRILAGTRYISYGALRRNTVPCSRRGASYYNCRIGAQANPYRRGCSAITRCRS